MGLKLKREILVILSIVIAIFGSIVLTHESDGVGGIVTFGIKMTMDYPGWNASDPVDLSTGFYGYDGQNDPIDPRWIEIRGEYEITSKYTHVLQQILVTLTSKMISEEFGDVDVEMFFDPDIMTFTNLMPGETQSQNFTLHVLLDQSVPAEYNEIEISGSWQNQPGMMGGEIPLTTRTPLHVAPVVSAHFNSNDDHFDLESYGEATQTNPIIINGNVFDPLLDIRIDGEERALDRGIEFTLEMGEEVDVGNYLLNFMIKVSVNDIKLGTITEVDIILVDTESGRELDIYNVVVEIVQTKQTQTDPYDDGDIPTKQPVSDDEVDNDANDVQLLDSSCCERHYEDDVGDDIFILGSIYSYEYEIGSRPQVDARSMNVWRENDELHIKVMTGAQVEGWTVMMVYILPDDSNKQGNIYQEDLEDATFLEYEPNKVLASNDIYAKGGYWPVELVRNGNSISAVGSVSDLMEFGLDADFEVFVQLLDLDPDLLMMDDIYELEIEMVVDYIGSGAGDVKDSSTPDPDKPSLMVEPDDIGGNILRIGIGAVIIGLIVAVIVFTVVKVRNKKKKNKT